jgi:hypothetical protein
LTNSDYESTSYTYTFNPSRCYTKHAHASLPDMPARKRGRAELEAPGPAQDEVQAQVPSLLSRLRNSWEFANLMQFIFIFGKALKIDDDFDVEVCSYPSWLLVFSFLELKPFERGY